LRELGRHDEASALLAEAVAKFPDNPQAASEVARVAEARSDWDGAVRAWAEVVARFPGNPEGPAGEARARRQLGQFDAADRGIEAALARFPDLALLAEQHGVNAMEREDWPLAVSRLGAAAKRFPAEAAIRQRLYEAQLRMAGSGAAPPPAALPPDADADRAVVMAFESLGGGGHGCEFGIFQRALGAEPLGLLRWADIRPGELTMALEAEFAGVGEPEHTRLFVAGSGARAEYWTSDHRYHMAMRTFVMADAVPEDRMRAQITQRLRFLRRKLIDDLRGAEKIFVYRDLRQDLPDAEITRLHAAVRRYGDATLFNIRYRDAAHPHGHVEAAGPGLLIGYIDRFSHDPASNTFLGHVHGALLALCREALRLRDATQP
jgi:tetratricopeptide (TPR) repeat protein